jgi:hypothetical protein
MGYTNLWKRLSPRQLSFLIQSFSLIAIFFEGYDQGTLLPLQIQKALQY